MMDFIERNFMNALEDLKVLSRIRSVSTKGEGIYEMVEALVSVMEKYGLKAKVLSTKGYPAIYAEEGEGRTILFYNHYDVQPPDPIDEWESPPFEPAIKEGKIFGRGVADNKGDIISRLLAVKAVRESMGKLPVKVKFLIEGEEEIGSPNLKSLIEENKNLLKADACIWESGGITWDDRPIIALGVKGILYVELEARGAYTELHSSYAPMVPNPAWRLIEALSLLRDRDGRILIDGFYDDVLEPGDFEISLLRDIPFDEAKFEESIGVKLLFRGDELKERYIFSPTCNICGIVSGYTGEGSKTIIPPYARAKIDFRLVPDQRSEDILGKLRAFLDKKGFGDIKINWWEGEEPSRTPPDDPFVDFVKERAREVYGKEPVIYPSFAGTGPMHPVREILKVPVVCIGTGYPESRCHAPNENIRISDFILSTKLIASIISGGSVWR